MTIRGLDDDLKGRLRVQAAVHGRSMEDEARDILRVALCREADPGQSLLASIRDKVQPTGGVELDLAPREPVRDPVNLG